MIERVSARVEEIHRRVRRTFERVQVTAGAARLHDQAAELREGPGHPERAAKVRSERRPRLTTGLGRRAGSPGPQDVAPKSTSLVSTVPAVRPGAVW
jgi:hypothetical protein